MTVDLTQLPDIKFVTTDFVTIRDNLIAEFTAETGFSPVEGSFTLALINALSSQIQLAYAALNETGKLNLLAFSRSTALDHLAALSGLSRLSPSFSTCTIQFTFPALVAAYTVPQGTRVQTSDGSYVFYTDEPLDLALGATTGTVTATTNTSGTAPNGYSAGSVNTLLDTLQVTPTTTVNTTETAGGAATEGDDAFRERIRLGGAEKSTAGAEDTYKLFARSANASIVDVSVQNTGPGEVTVWGLLAGGSAPGAVINAQILAAVNDESVRPLTDNVTVEDPTAATYSISVTVDYYKSYSELWDTIKDQIETDLESFADIKAERLGADIVPDQIKKICMDVAGVYQVTVVSPSYTTVSNSQWPDLSGSVTVTKGTEYDERP